MKIESENKSPQKKYAFWGGLAINGLCFYLIIRTINWEEFLTTLRATDWFFLGLGVFFFFLSLVMRALRWQSLLSPLQKVSVWDSFAYLMVGYLANLILPLRAGELFRLALLGYEKRIDVGATLATLVVEKLLDMVSLLVFIVALPLTMDIPSELKSGIFLIEIVAVLMLVILMVFSFQRRDLAWVESLIPGFVLDAAKFKALALLHSFIEGLAALQSWKQFLLVVFYSIVDWILAAISTYFFMLAAGLSLTWSAPLMVLVVTNLGTAVVSAPGGFGVVHLLTTVVLGASSVSKSIAFGFAVLWHETIVIVEMVIGFICLWGKGLSLGQFERQSVIGSTDTVSMSD